MAEGTVRYDEEKNIVYAIAGDTHQREEYKAFDTKWCSVVKDKGLKDYNTIIDMSKVDVHNYHPQRKEDSGDPAWWDYGFESIATRRAGNGKVVLVYSRAKGNCPEYMIIYQPDAAVESIEDAENFILTGVLYDRA